VIIYHLLTHGQAYANVEDGQRVSLSAGDIVVFPHGDPHLMETVAMSSRGTMPRSFRKSCRRVSSWRAWEAAARSPDSFAANLFEEFPNPRPLTAMNCVAL
jgi:hypothetical protein